MGSGCALWMLGQSIARTRNIQHLCFVAGRMMHRKSGGASSIGYEAGVMRSVTSNFEPATELTSTLDWVASVEEDIEPVGAEGSLPLHAVLIQLEQSQSVLRSRAGCSGSDSV
jgi:hypothetical protein